jgi:D-arabinose 1-dehydrogenase-like Zn-dependent alcohol dehydrogenase
VPARLVHQLREPKITGITHDGGHADYAVVPAESARGSRGMSAVDAGLCCVPASTPTRSATGVHGPGTPSRCRIGGLGHLAIQYAVRMGFRTIAISRSEDKAQLARELGAHEYVDTQRVEAAAELQKLGGADPCSPRHRMPRRSAARSAGSSSAASS